MGPSVRRAAEALARASGAVLVEEDAHAFRILGGPAGDVAVELDLRHVHPERHPDLPGAAPGPLAAAVAGHVAGPFVPRELITGPLPPADLPLVDDLLDALREAGAGGHGATLLAGSLGLHFNIDPPDLEPAGILAVLAAYVASEPVLRAAIGGGDPRRLAAMPPPFPDAYADRIRAPAYRPDWPELTRDYLAHNPTRDRGLDLLPLLLDREPALVRAALPVEKITARPVFHYRLPQAHPGDPSWSVVADWNRWVALEARAEAAL